MDYVNPFKNVVKSFSTLWRLAVDYDEDRWSSNPKEELLNLLKTTVLAPSMLGSTLVALADEENYPYQYATVGDENIKPLEGILNAVAIAAGFAPQMGGEHTWTFAERMAKK